MAPNSHQKRLLTGLTLAAFLVACLVYQGVLVFIAALIFSIWGLWEFYSLFWPGRKWLPAKLLGTILAIGVLSASWNGRPDLTMALVITGFWGSALIFLFDKENNKHSSLFAEHLVLPASLIYIPVTLQFFFQFSTVECIMVLAAAFAADTAAYYTGVHFGKHKLWPRVSPKKTWEGSFGSLTGTLLVCLLLGIFLGQAPWWAFFFLGLVLNLAAQLGDLVESALKRSLEIKDSGYLLPGHGGLLDRIDALLFVIPVYAACRLAVTFF